MSISGAFRSRQVGSPSAHQVHPAWEKSMEETDDQKSEKEETFSRRFLNFTSEVSVGGVKYVTDDTSGLFRRLLWLTLVLCGLGFMIYQISNRVEYYMTYPTTIDLKINFNKTMLFPIVTVCNENLIVRSRARKLGK